MSTPCCTDIVSVPGPRGLRGIDGIDGIDGINAFTVTTAAFEMPAEGDDVPVFVEENGWAGVGQLIFITNAGTFRVVSKTGTTEFLLLNVADSATGAYADNATPGIEISSGQQVSPAGESGVTGIGGADGIDGTDGVNAFTVTTANFTQPAEGATVTIEVADSTWIIQGQPIYNLGGGNYEVTAIPDSTHVTLRNLEDTALELYPGNAAPGAIIGSGAGVSPGGIQGPEGATGAAGTPAVGITHYFRADKNGVAQTQDAGGIGTDVTFDTERFDDGGVYDATTSIWTCPEDGIYEFFAQRAMVLPDGTGYTFSLFKNGGFGSGTQIAVAVGLETILQIITGPMQFAAGDTIQVHQLQTGGSATSINGAISTTWFSGYMIAAL